MSVITSRITFVISLIDFLTFDFGKSIRGILQVYGASVYSQSD